MNAQPLTFTEAIREFHERTQGQFAALDGAQYLPNIASYCRARGWPVIAEPIEMHYAVAFEVASRGNLEL